MNYTDNTNKFACILNRRTAPPVALNAMAHAMAGLVSTLPEGAADFLDYRFKGDAAMSVISRYPVIVLEAKNASQLRTAWGTAQSEAIVSNVFALSMIGASAAEQREATAQTDPETAELVALTLFGSSDRIDRITRKFSLFRDRTVANGGNDVPGIDAICSP
jgi:hypothetical protein